MGQLNPLPDDKILGLPKLKAFADDKENVSQNVQVVFDRIENIVGKEENGFSFSHNVFKRFFPQERQKSSLSGKELRCVCWQHRSKSGNLNVQPWTVFTKQSYKYFQTFAEIVLFSNRIFLKNRQGIFSNPFPYKPLFLRVCGTNLLKTL